MAAGEDLERECGCLCDSWGHQGCLGRGETLLVIGSRTVGSVVVLICQSCARAISEQRPRPLL